jgi:ABC-type polysaccharide/polyol phosphate transport system ATPase subunit
MSRIVVDNVTVDFPIYGSHRSFRTALLQRAAGGLIRREGAHNERIVVRALDRVSVQVENGDRVGVVGHNGAGKSTLLRVLAGVYEPVSGTISSNGKISALFTTSPGLDVDDTGYENILTCGLFLGLSRDDINAKIGDIEQFCELGDYLSLPVRTYSSGMLMRLAFAIATVIHPEILLLDEGLGVSDARFQERAAKRVDALVERSNILVLASHSEALIRRMCNRAVLMHEGRVIADGGVEDTLAHYARLNAGAAG